MEPTPPTAQYAQHPPPAAAAKFCMSTPVVYARGAMLESGRMGNPGRCASNAQPTAASVTQVLPAGRVRLDTAIPMEYVQFASVINMW